MLFLTGCGTRKNGELSGVVNLWHGWGQEEAVILNQVITSFIDSHPNATVRATAIEPQQLRSRFEQSAISGLGPDLLLGPSNWILPLADAGLIRPIESQVPPALWERYLPEAVETVRYQGSMYGLPESLRLLGLYYNKRLVDTPPITLDALVEEANQGKRVGMSPTFVDTFWGIQAFGGQLFDENERVVLDNGGLANWLAWLKTTLDTPNIVLDKDAQTLTTFFSDGELAYLVAGSWMRKPLQAAVGEDSLGVAPLPSGPIKEAGPFLETNVLMFSIASSSRQQELAVALATFITNAEQQTLLMRRAGRIPTNNNVRNNPSIDPLAYAFRAQARSAVPFRNSQNMEAVLNLGDSAFNRALQGVEEPIVVASELTNAINEANGFTTKIELTDRCLRAGKLSISIGESEPEGEMLRTIGKQYEQMCPSVKIAFNTFPITETPEQLMGNVTTNHADLMLIPNRWVMPLGLGDFLQPLNGLIDTQQLQSYHPDGVETMRFNNQLYGIPFTLMPQALYVNMSIVSSPAQVLADLISQDNIGQVVAMPLSFVDTYWGVPAYGGRLFDEEGRVVLDPASMVAWLQWMAEARTTASMVIDTDQATLRARFTTGAVAYLVDRPQALAHMEDALGADLRIVRLPTGPVADAAPFLLTTGLVLSKSIPEEQTQLAIDFIAYATNSDNQTKLVNEGRLLPANISVPIDPSDPLFSFAKEANANTSYPNLIQMAMVEQLGMGFYTHLLSDEIDRGIELDALVRDIVADINRANGFELPIEDGNKGDTETDSIK